MRAWRRTILETEQKLRGGKKWVTERRRFNKALRGGEVVNVDTDLERAKEMMGSRNIYSIVDLDLQDGLIKLDLGYFKAKGSIENILHLGIKKVHQMYFDRFKPVDSFVLFVQSLEQIDELRIGGYGTKEIFRLNNLFDALAPVKLKRLEILYLVVSLSGVEKLKDLEVLEMQNCEISDVSTIGQLINLGKLDIRESKISSLPSSLRDLRSLKELMFGWTNIQPTSFDINNILHIVKHRDVPDDYISVEADENFRAALTNAVDNDPDLEIRDRNNPQWLIIGKKRSLEDDAPNFQTGDGKAYEVHNTFQQKYEEFKDNIDVMKDYVGDWDASPTEELTTAKSYVEDADNAYTARFAVLKYYLQHMIDVVANDEKPTMTYDAFKAVAKVGEEWIDNDGDRFKIVSIGNVIKARFKKELTFDSTDSILDDEYEDHGGSDTFTFAKYTGQLNKKEQNRKLDRIFDRLRNQSISGQLYVYSVLAIKFILKINNPILTNEYVSRFIDECVHAYGQATTP